MTNSHAFTHQTMRILFLIFVILFSAQLSDAFAACYVCSASNSIGFNDTNSCEIPNSNQTPIKHNCSFCQEVIMPNSEGDAYELHRFCSRRSIGIKSKCNQNEFETNFCQCKTNTCNANLKFGVPFKCYSCGYSTNSLSISTNNGMEYASDERCLNPNETITPTMSCNSTCIEYARIQTFDSGEVVGILVRDCEERLANSADQEEERPKSKQRECRASFCNGVYNQHDLYSNEVNGSEFVAFSTKAFSIEIVLVISVVGVLKMNLLE